MGWAADERDAENPPRIVVLHGSTVVGEATPSIRREDLPIGGRGFALPVPGWLELDGGPVALTMRIASGTQSVDVVATLCADPIAGWVDAQEGLLVRGWACNVFDPMSPVSVDILLDGVPVDRVDADRPRSDLEPYGWGHCGFEWILRERFVDGRSRSITARVTNGQTFLSNGIATVAASPDTLAAEVRDWLYLRRRAMAEATATARSTLGRSDGQNPVGGLAPPPRALPQRDRQILLGAAMATRLDREDVTGKFLGVSEGVARGWIAAWSELSAPVLDILIDDRLIERVRAEAPDPATGRCPFAWPVPARFHDGSDHRIEARLTNTSIVLSGPTSASTFVPPMRGEAAWRVGRVRSNGRHNLVEIDARLIRHASQIRPATALTSTDLLLDRLMPPECPIA